ncbi:MAG: hypothetical protein ABIO79_09055, partial [Ferruginibacter sp.]
SSTTTVVFTTNNTGGTTTYAWTNNTTSIGLAASGNGNIPSFVAVNTGTAPVIATITVTPTFTNDGVSCPGASKTFTITVNPTGQVNQPANQTLCNGSSTTTVVFTTNNTGGTTTYAWTNNTTSIGLAASGNGNIPSFVAVNTGTAPVIATITVTPTFTNDGVSCPGASKTFTITVNPTGQVNQPANQTLCNGSSTTTVVFTTNNTGGTTTYAWTNNTTSIGLAASGNGNIASFVAVNTGTAPVIATITVTPTFTNDGVSCPGPSKTFTITVNPTPTADQIADRIHCHGDAGAAINFTSPVVGTTYTWTSSANVGFGTGGNGNIPAYVAANLTNAPIVATVTVTPSANNCPGPTMTFTVTVNPIPATTASNSGPLCVGGTLNLFASNSLPGASFSWTGPNSFTSLVQNPPAITNAQLINAGDYTVTVSLNGCSSQSTTTVVIVENPIIFNLTATNYCAGDPNKGSATLDGSQVGKNYTLLDDSFIPVAGQPVLPGTGGSLTWTVLDAGGYAVQATGEQPTNCANLTNPVTVVENPLPNPVVADTSVCMDACIDLIGTPAGGVWSGQGVTGSQFCANGLQPGQYIITYTVTNEENCSNSTTATVTVTSCVNGICTYTQGAYGSAGGTMCNGTYGGISTDSLIYKSITNWGGTLTVGRNARTVVMTNAATNRACIIAKLPGGGPSKELNVGNYNICSVPASYLQNGKFKNTLLAQNITLGLNIGITTNPSILGDFILQGGILATAKPLGGCGSNTPILRTCHYDTVPPYRVIVENEYQYFNIDPAVVAAIVPDINGHRTVRGLFELANDALANTDNVNNKENGVLISKIADVVEKINRGFDECRIFIGWNVPPCVPPAPPFSLNQNTLNSRVFATADASANINVSTYPNPFSDKVKFEINSKISGEAILEVYNMMGSKLQVVYRGHIFAGKGQVIEYRVPQMNRTNLIYVLRIGDKTVTGKLTNIK